MKSFNTFQRTIAAWWTLGPPPEDGAMGSHGGAPVFRGFGALGAVQVTEGECLLTEGSPGTTRVWYHVGKLQSYKSIMFKDHILILLTNKWLI